MLPRILSGRTIVAHLRFRQSSRVEHQLRRAFSAAFTPHLRFEQESTKRILAFKSVVLVPDYCWAKVQGSTPESLKLRLNRRNGHEEDLLGCNAARGVRGPDPMAGENFYRCRSATGGHQERGARPRCLRRWLWLGRRSEDT